MTVMNTVKYFDRLLPCTHIFLRSVRKRAGGGREEGVGGDALERLKSRADTFKREPARERESKGFPWAPTLTRILPRLTNV